MSLLRLRAISFASPVVDPAAPKGLHRRDFGDGYAIELDGARVTVTAPDGMATVTTVPFHGIAAPAPAAPAAKPPAPVKSTKGSR